MILQRFSTVARIGECPSISAFTRVFDALWGMRKSGLQAAFVTRSPDCDRAHGIAHTENARRDRNPGTAA